jgi:hypothetical protein
MKLLEYILITYFLQHLQIYADIHKARDARDFASEGDLYERLLSLFLIHKETSIDKDRSSCQKTVNELSTAECPV